MKINYVNTPNNYVKYNAKNTNNNMTQLFDTFSKQKTDIIKHTNSSKDSFEQNHNEKFNHSLMYTKLKPNITTNNIKTNNIQIINAGSNPVAESDNYNVTYTNDYLIIYDKNQNSKFYFTGDEIKLQIDKTSDYKFLFNDDGGDSINFILVDDELEKMIDTVTKANGNSLERIPLTDYTLNTHKQTGIKFITRNGFEGAGGKILNNYGQEKYDELVKEYEKYYPPSQTACASLYAAFEIYGLMQRTTNGLVQISQDGIHYNSHDGDTYYHIPFNNISDFYYIKDYLNNYDTDLLELEKHDVLKDILKNKPKNYTGYEVT